MHGPFGLAAGFDKNAVAIDGMSMLGFDHIEIGTVTGEPQPGNPKKRLFRLVADRALINRMGFNNEGSAAVAERLAARNPVFRTTVGVNIGKTKVVPETEAVGDYVKSTERLARHADYLVVNVSSPNTPGLRNLQATEALRPLLTAVREAADRTVTDRRVPLLVKIAPDLADEDVDAVADLAVELGLDGIIATNTTIARDGLGLKSSPSLVKETGGLSGAPSRRAPWRSCSGSTRASATRSPSWASAASRRPRTPGSASSPAPPSSRVTAPSSTRARSTPARSTRVWPRASPPPRTPPSPRPSAPRPGRS